MEMDLDFTKRRFTNGVAIATGLALIPSWSKAASPYAIPLIAGGVISTVVSGIFQFFARSRQDTNEIAAEKRQKIAYLEAQRRNIMMEHANYLFGQLPLNERLILLRDGSFYNALLSERFDEIGTRLAVTNGQLHLSRGMYGAPIPSDLGNTIASEVLPKTGVAPVPVDISPLEDDRINNRVKGYLAEKENLSIAQYDIKYTPSTISKMSFARNPTSRGSDFAFVSSIDKTRPVSNGSLSKTYAVKHSDVPRSVYS